MLPAVVATTTNTCSSTTATIRSSISIPKYSHTMDKTRKRGKRTVETGGSIILNDTTNHHSSRTNMQVQQQLMASVSVPARVQYYCSARRVMYSAIFFVICIYIDIVASNVATNRWASELREEQKAMPLPDILHNSFELPDAKNISHKLLKELPLYFTGILLVVGFILPYDVMGWRNVNLTEYRRYEACIRYMETRCVLELMRALSVWVTTQSDAHGLHCKDIEAHTIDNIFTTFTFGRCGDNMFSGHASSLLSFATAIQTYNINLMLGGRKNGS